jgi:hypothetical protein
MNYWLKIPVFTRKVGVLSKFRNLTDLVTWNPGISIEMNAVKIGHKLSKILFPEHQRLDTAWVGALKKA